MTLYYLKLLCIKKIVHDINIYTPSANNKLVHRDISEGPLWEPKPLYIRSHFPEHFGIRTSDIIILIVLVSLLI